MHSGRHWNFQHSEVLRIHDLAVRSQPFPRFVSKKIHLVLETEAPSISCSSDWWFPLPAFFSMFPTVLVLVLLLSSSSLSSFWLWLQAPNFFHSIPSPKLTGPIFRGYCSLVLGIYTHFPYMISMSVRTVSMGLKLKIIKRTNLTDSWSSWPLKPVQSDG